MPGVGFEPTVPASARSKTVNALDLSATVNSHNLESFRINLKVLARLNVQA
jgi:hypothetical protein